jgi:hypothetical protein
MPNWYHNMLLATLGIAAFSMALAVLAMAISLLKNVLI